MNIEPQIGAAATVMVSSQISAQGSFEGWNEQGKAKIRVGQELVTGTLIPRVIDAASDAVPAM